MTEHPSDTPRRGRGRPCGSTPYKDVDARIMRGAGHALLAEPTLSERAAILRAVVRETAKPVEQARALRRVQGKMKRDVVIAEAAERRAEEARKAEEMRRALLTVLDFAAGGPTFQRFTARPDVQEFGRKVAAFSMMTHEVAENVVRNLAPIYAGIHQIRTRAVNEMLRLR